MSETSSFDYDAYHEAKQNALIAEETRQRVIAESFRNGEVHPASRVRDAYIFCYKKKGVRFRIATDHGDFTVEAQVDFSKGADARIGFSLARSGTEVLFIPHMEAMAASEEFLKEVIERL